MPKEVFDSLRAVTKENIEKLSNTILEKKISAHKDKIEYIA